MYNIDFNKVINDNLDFYSRQQKRVSFLRAGVKGLKNLYADFLAFRADVEAKIYHNGQIIYLEKRLNDQWDPINRGIYIDDLAQPPFYIRKKTEIVPPLYLYRKFVTRVYANGEYCVFNNRVYVCTFSTNQSPAVMPFKWADVGEVLYLRRKSEFLGSIDFVVYVPNAVVFDQNQMKSVINYYKQAGKNYIILTY